MTNANQMWKQQKKDGQTTLEFKPWLDREKTKAYHNFDDSVPIPVNKPLNDSIQTAVRALQVKSGYKETTSSKYILGVDKRIIYGIGAVGIVLIGFAIYKKVKK